MENETGQAGRAIKRRIVRRIIGLVFGTGTMVFGILLPDFFLVALVIGVPVFVISLCNLMEPNDNFTNEDHIRFLRRHM